VKNEEKRTLMKFWRTRLFFQQNSNNTSTARN